MFTANVGFALVLSREQTAALCKIHTGHSMLTAAEVTARHELFDQGLVMHVGQGYRLSPAGRKVFELLLELGVSLPAQLARG